jgi:uncharacterized membrane protein
MDILDGFRVFLGSIFVLFLPGFVWSFLFFEKGKIDWIERAALSFGLSLALVPLTVFWLNFLFNMKVTWFNTMLVVSALIALPLIYLLIRRPSFRKDVEARVKGWFKPHRGK